MPFRLPVFRFPLRVHHLFALAAGLGLVIGAYAAGGHDSGSSHATTATTTASEAEDRPKVIGKGELKRKAAAAKAVQAEAPAASSASEPSSVSMSDLRELIDQKIAEVRAKQAAAPAVKVVAKSPKPRPAPKAVSAAQNDAHGALLPKDGHGHDVHWQYGGATGPQSWGQLKPEFQSCKLGKRQSPIDIRDGIKVDLEPIRFDYRPSTFRIVDNGHTISVNVGDSRFSLIGKTYELDDIHFHRPAEMLINGQRHEMSIHLVHRSLDGAVAVVALLLERGAEHPEIQTLWNYLPLEKNTPVQPPKAVINPARLLPESAQYYTFMGSLTTPPCSEDVLWLVLKQPQKMSVEQMMIFARLYSNNARPVQPGSGRLIKESR